MKPPSRLVRHFNRVSRRAEILLARQTDPDHWIDELTPGAWVKDILPDVRAYAEHYHPSKYTFQGYYQACATVAEEVMQHVQAGRWQDAAEKYRLLSRLQRYPDSARWRELVPDFIPST